MHLLPPFIRKFGIIPSSYKIAMTYEEQLLWLCKYIEDLESTLNQSFEDFQTLINQSLQELDDEKQDKLTAGDNIEIINNVISAIVGEDLTGSLTSNLYYGDYDVGETLPTVPLTFEDTACIVISEIATPTNYKIKGNYIVYEIDPDTREILRKDSATLEDTYGSFTTTGSKTLVVEFSDTANYPARLVKLADYQTQINNLEENKQDKLTAGDNITIENNVISATGGGDSVIHTLEEDLDLSTGIYEPQEGLYYTGDYTIKTYNSTLGTYETLVDNNTLCNLDYSYQTIEVLDYPSLPNTLRRYFTFSNSKWHLTQYNQNDIITKFTESVTLSSGTVPFSQGLYYTGDYKLINTNSNDIFPENTLFFYNSTNNEFLKLTNTTFSSQIGSEYWRYLDYSNLWYKLDYDTTGTINSSSTSTQIPTAEAVYRYVSGLPASPITTFTENVTLTGSNPTLSEGLYYTGEYSLKNVNDTTMIDEHSLFYYASQNKIFIRLTQKSMTASAEILIDYWDYNSQSSRWVRHYKQLTPTISSSSTISQIPTAKAVYDAINKDSGWVDISSYLNTSYFSVRSSLPPQMRKKDGIIYFVGQVYCSHAPRKHCCNFIFRTSCLGKSYNTNRWKWRYI